jgi:hypothetical protein
VQKSKQKGKEAKAQRVIDRLRRKEIRQHSRGCPKRRRYWAEETTTSRFSFRRAGRASSNS